MKILPCLLLAVLLVACTPRSASFETSAEPTAVPTLGSAENTATPVDSTETSLVWDAASTAPILRLEETGGLLQSAWGTGIPQWTLHGDGLVVWTQDGEPTPGFTSQVWTGHLDQAEIVTLLAFAQEIGFFDLDAEYKAPRYVQAETDNSGATDLEFNLQGAPDQPTGSITVDLVTGQHRVQVYPAAWTEAPEAYRALRERLLSTRPADAAPFAPMALSLSATPVTPDSTSVPPQWPFADLILADAAAEPLQLDAAQGSAVAEFLATQGVVAVENGQAFRLDLWATPPPGP